MAGKEIAVKKYVVRLGAEERDQLNDLIRSGKRSAQLLTKAHILLKADVSDAGEGWSDSAIAEDGRTRCGARGGMQSCRCARHSRRLRRFIWFATIVAGLTVRAELLGVTSIVRALNLRPRLYTTLLKNFHSSALKLDRLSALWAQAVLRLFQ